MKYQLTLNNLNYLIEQNGKEVKVSEGKNVFEFEVLSNLSGLMIKEVNFFYAKVSGNHWEGVFQKESAGGAKKETDGTIRCPFPGKVTKVHVGEKSKVAKDMVLLVVEAMKMEYEIIAPFDGVVENLMVKMGDQTKKDQILAEIKKA